MAADLLGRTIGRRRRRGARRRRRRRPGPDRAGRGARGDRACSAARRPRSPPPRPPCSTRTTASATPRSGRSAPWPTTRRWRRSPGCRSSPATRARPSAPRWPACSDRADRTRSSQRLIAELLEDPDRRRAWPASPPSAGCATPPRSTPPAPCSATHRPGSASRPSRRWRHSPTVRDSEPADRGRLDDDAAPVRRAAAAALAGFETTPAGVTDVLLHGSPRAQEAALLALRGHGPDVRADRHRLDDRGPRAGDPPPTGSTVLAGAEPDATVGPSRRSPSCATSSPAASSGSRTSARGAGGPRGARGWRRPPPVPSIGRPRDQGAGDRGARLDRRSTPVRRARPAARGRGRRRAGSRCRRAPACSMMTTRGSRA